MDCRSALETLETVPSRRLQAERTEFAAFHAHIQSCGLCRVAFDSRRLEEDALVRALNDVPVPSGLESRICDRLEAEPRKRGRRWWKLVGAGGAVVAAGLMVAASWSLWTNGWLTLEQVRLAVNEAVLRVERPERGPPRGAIRDVTGREGGAVSATVSDRDWRSMIAGRPPLAIDVDRRWGGGPDATVYRFSDGATRVEGVLVMIPRRRVAAAPQNPVPMSVEYLPLPTASWSDSEYVYVCIAQSGDLGRLLRSMYGTTA